MIDELLGALKAAPQLKGARCKDRSHSWDETECLETIEYAINMCNSCPALIPCREWSSKQKRLTGVVGGQLHQFHNTNTRKEKAS